MAKINNIEVKTSRNVVPKIYAYTTPEIARHDGWTKIGYTEQDDVNKRISQQTHTADVIYKLEWSGNAFYEQSMESFTDKEFHAYLRKLKYEQKPDTEWIHITPNESKYKFYDFRQNQGILEDITDPSPYKLRPEQEKAVIMTEKHYKENKNGQFLWNAKPRFGKTLSVYDFCKRINAVNVLIVTNRPAISNSWYSDYEKFLGTSSGYRFVSEDENLKGKSLVMSREKYQSFSNNNRHLNPKCIEFMSLQDMKGSLFFGNPNGYNKLEAESKMHWDVLVIDEAHEGVDTYKTDRAFDQVKRDFTLHLSGTPFKALANDKFKDDEIYNWTYADEQEAKKNWAGEAENPYIALPKLSLFTYQMSDIVENRLKKGIEIDEKTEEYAFDLNEFFLAKNGKFIHDEAVDKFLEALTTQEKFPFSTPELRNELKHTFWILNRVESAKALAVKLKAHPIFQEYEIVLAAGDGRLYDNDSNSNEKSYKKVVKAIEDNDKTITLSVGQLTTGVTIPEWTAVLMLSNMESPSLYMQAAFRSQNPCLIYEDGKYKRKENAYVFDFDPARTLNIFEQFANNLSNKTANGKGSPDDHKENIKQLLNFFPVYAEDKDGKMVDIDATQVLRIPRKIRSNEVVKRGFMSNFLFQNISIVFGAPNIVRDIINKFTPVNEPKRTKLSNEDTDAVNLDDDGNVEIPNEIIVGKSQDIFGTKHYEDIAVSDTQTIFNQIKEPETIIDKSDELVNNLHKSIQENVINHIIKDTKESYGQDLRKSEQNNLEKTLNDKVKTEVRNKINDFNQKNAILDLDLKKELQNCVSDEQVKKTTEKYKDLKQDTAKVLNDEISNFVQNFTQEAEKETVRAVEQSVQEEKKRNVENNVKDRLRGFARTIPSFLMAYGADNDVLLETFDQIIPEDVFKDVTSITLDQFRFSRDGGDYTNEETGEIEHFDGHIFDATVFNDSITVFIELKDKLSNYFDDKQKEDIFDYIPPQKTNQIFTPKKIVKEMVDVLEQQDSLCFDNPDKTFVDLYMKSGLYITEIVKRLYNSKKMKELYPNSNERLKHIFEKQVYGLAPTEIIYRISLNFILGFDKNNIITKHNFRQIDTLPLVESGGLEQKLDELFKGDE